MDLEPSGMAALKKCSKCAETKPLDQYYPHKLTKDRKQSCCKTCSNEATKRSKNRNTCVDCGVFGIDYKATRCPSCSKSGAQHPKWRGGRYVDARSGYVLIHADNALGKVFEHRRVMEQHLGRELLPGETVHHKNGVRDDNRLENLELWSKTQPAGQRVEDKVEWAIELLRLYRPDLLA